RLAIRLQPLEALGRNSYSMYLSHFAVIFGLRQIWPFADGLVSLLLAYAVTGALSYLVARATWHLVERHAQDLAHRLTSSKKAAPRHLEPGPGAIRGGIADPVAVDGIEDDGVVGEQGFRQRKHGALDGARVRCREQQSTLDTANRRRLLVRECQRVALLRHPR